jgi:CHASE2 domain-containing sensor protein/signal transduction histidine kinase
VIASLRRIERLAAEWWLVLLVTAALVVGSLATSFTLRADMLLYDFLQRIQQHSPNPDILLVSIDDRSLAEIGPWPWPRADQAKLLSALSKGEPRGVVLDVLLLDSREPEGDAALGHAIASGPPTYLPVQFQIPGRNGADHDILEPQPAFRDAAAGLGQANLIPDGDGIVRRAYLDYFAGTQHWPHLVTLITGNVNPPKTPLAKTGEKDVIVASQPVLISYTGPQGSFSSISAASVIKGELPPEALGGRLVLVGVTATGVGDAYATPVGSDKTLMPGLEVQANLLDSLLSDRVVTPVEGPLRYAFALAPILAMMLGLRYLRPRWTIALLVALLAGTVAATVILLPLGWWLAPGSALLGMILAYPVWNWRRLATVSTYFVDELEKLQSEHDPLERARPNLAGLDLVDRQMSLLRSAIGRERDLRRFFVDRIAQMPDAVVVAGTTGKVVLANDAARALWQSLGGREAPETIADLLACLKAADGNAMPAFAPQSAWQADTITSDGRCFALRSEPQRGADDEVVGTVLRLADTTDALNAERERAEVMQLLSHDMRAPQVSILTLLDSSGKTALKQPTAQRIKAYAERTLRLADGFVQLSRAQSLQFKPEVIDLCDVAKEAIDALWPQADANGIAVRGTYPDEEVLIRGERSLLARMLVNLVENAIRFSKSGQVVMVTVSSVQSDGQSLSAVSVADNGPGIAPERLQQLFQRFQSSGPGKASGGIGLGLALVHTTVVRHGGTIDCTSSDKGTTFEIRLPRCEDDS